MDDPRIVSPIALGSGCLRDGRRCSEAGTTGQVSMRPAGRGTFHADAGVKGGDSKVGWRLVRDKLSWCWFLHCAEGGVGASQRLVRGYSHCYQYR